MLATRVALHERMGDAAGARALVKAALEALQGPVSGRGRAPAAGGAAGEGVAWLLERLARLQLQARLLLGMIADPARPCFDPVR